MASKPIILRSSATYNGDDYEIIFAYLKLKLGWKASAIFKNRTKKTKLVAPRDSIRMLQIWDYEFWPEFARSLANPANDESNQERLF